MQFRQRPSKILAAQLNYSELDKNRDGREPKEGERKMDQATNSYNSFQNFDERMLTLKK